MTVLICLKPKRRMQSPNFQAARNFRRQYKKEEVIQWLKNYCQGDLFDMAFREKIIDTFINSVFLFDDKLIIYYNVKHGKQVSYIEALEDASETDSPCSDSDKTGSPVGLEPTTLRLTAACSTD